MNTTIRRRVLTLGCMFASLAFIVPAAPSHAAQPSQDQGVGIAALRNGICEAGEFCVFRNAAGGGSVHDWGRGFTDMNYNNDTYFNTTTRVGGTVSSVRNRTGCPVRVFAATDLNPPGWTIPADGKTYNFTNNSPVHNDQPRSHQAQC